MLLFLNIYSGSANWIMNEIHASLCKMNRFFKNIFWLSGKFDIDISIFDFSFKLSKTSILSVHRRNSYIVQLPTLNTNFLLKQYLLRAQKLKKRELSWDCGVKFLFERLTMSQTNVRMSLDMVYAITREKDPIVQIHKKVFWFREFEMTFHLR